MDRSRRQSFAVILSYALGVTATQNLKNAPPLGDLGVPWRYCTRDDDSLQAQAVLNFLAFAFTGSTYTVFMIFRHFLKMKFLSKQLTDTSF